MRRFVLLAGLGVCSLVVPGCAITGDGGAAEPPPAPQLEVAHEFGPIVYRIHADARDRWERVLDLQRRLYSRQRKVVEDDHLHLLYKEADTDDDDILDPEEVEAAWHRMRIEYERRLVKDMDV